MGKGRRRSGRGRRRRPGGVLLVRRAWNCIRGIARDYYVNTFRCDDSSVNDVICYRERQFTFNNTPVMKPSKKTNSMRSFLQSVPCINPANIIFRDQDVISVSDGRLERKYCYQRPEEEGEGEEEVVDDDGDEQMFSIDVKAELFIRNFYQRQRQLSPTRYY